MVSAPSVQYPSGLPTPDADALAHSQAVAQHIAAQIDANPDHAIPFEEWMELALYAPGLGYYVSGTPKFGGSAPTGDFATAPELIPLFGHTLARQVQHILDGCSSTGILEFGAGSGALAEAVMNALVDAGHNVQYAILELSPDVRARQQQRLAHCGERVEWLDTLP